MLLFFFFTYIQCALNIYPFVRNGRSVQNIGNTRFVLYDSNAADNISYEYNYGDNSNPNRTSSLCTNHAFEFPGQYTIMASKFTNESTNFIKGYAQKTISVNHVQEFYTFIVMGPFDNITNDDQVTPDLGKIENSKLKYNSLDYNSLPIPPNSSYWKLQIASDEVPSGEITKYYLDSGLEPRITVTNSSIQITVAGSFDNMWLLKISANEVEPVSIAAKFEIYSSNLLLNPAGSNIYFTTRVFWTDIYDMTTEAELPNVSVKISPVSISQNSGVYVYNGSIYMTDDSYTTFHKLIFKELSNQAIDEAIFCTICFACTSNNKIYYRNYFVNDTLILIPNHPQNIEQLHIYSCESDDIPRETIASDIYDIAGPFFASYSSRGNSNSNPYFSVLRFNGTTQIISLERFPNITSVVYVTAISNVDWVVVVVNEANESENTSSILQINFKTLSITRIDSYRNILNNNETIVGAYLQPCTEELVTYTNNSVFITFDMGKTQITMGNIQNGVASITSRHSADEIYILDNEGNFYIIFGERKIMHLFESFKFEGLSLAVDSADTLYLLTDEKDLYGCRAIPVESYISCFAISHTFEKINNDENNSSDFNLEIVQSLDGQSYQVMTKPDNINYFSYLSIFSTEGVEECKIVDYSNCKRLYDGEVFSSFDNVEIDQFSNLNFEEGSYSIKFKSKNYLKQNDIGKSLFILEIVGIFEITGCEDDTFFLKNTSKLILINNDLNGSSATCQIIDLRPIYNSSNISVSYVEPNEDGYEIGVKEEEYKFNPYSVGLIIESKDSENNIFKGVIYRYIDSTTVVVKPIDSSGGSLDSSSNLVIRSPDESIDDEAEFSLEPIRQGPWHLGFSLCGGSVESQGTSSFHQNLPVYRLLEDEDLVYDMVIPSEKGAVQTRFSQPDLVLSTTNIDNHRFVYNMYINSSTIIDTPSSSTSSSASSGATDTYNSISGRFSIPFTRVISLYKDGSPRCVSLSIIGVSPLCPPDQRLVVTPDGEERDIIELDVNYRPPSIEGNQIGLSKNVYNRNPANSKILKSRLKKSREQYAPVPNRCRGASDVTGCHCERAELEKMNEEDTDCLKIAYSHDFSVTFSPRVHLQSYIGGNWVVTDPEPQVYLTEVNGRDNLCVNGKCTKSGDDELVFKTGDEIQMKGIELWHLKFRTIGSCSVSCYYMMYIKRPPLMKNMVYLIQGIAAIGIGLILWLMVKIKIAKERKASMEVDTKSKKKKQD